MRGVRAHRVIYLQTQTPRDGLGLGFALLNLDQAARRVPDIGRLYVTITITISISIPIPITITITVREDGCDIHAKHRKGGRARRTRSCVSEKMLREGRAEDKGAGDACVHIESTEYRVQAWKAPKN